MRTIIYATIAVLLIGPAGAQDFSAFLGSPGPKIFSAFLGSRPLPPPQPLC